MKIKLKKTAFFFFTLFLSFLWSNQPQINFQRYFSSDSTIAVVHKDYIIPIKSISFLKSNHYVIDKSTLESSNFFSPIHLINWNTISFLLDPGLPSNFYGLEFFQSEQRSTSYLINERELNEPLTGLFDLRDFRFDELQSIEFIIPTRSFLLSRNNNENAVIFNESQRYSTSPYSRLKYIEAPYDNLFFDGLFNVNFTHKNNFEFGITKHNALGRFINSEKDLWAGKLKLTHYFSNKVNLGLTYRYSKSLVRFNEGINLNNPLLSPGSSIDEILYDNQKALVVNDDAYHKWTFNTWDLIGLIQPNDKMQTLINAYYIQSLREFRDNEHKADSLRIFDDHLSKVVGISVKENLRLLFNKTELSFNFENISIESPNYFSNLSENRFNAYIFNQFDFSKNIIPSYYLKVTGLNNLKNSLISFGADIYFKINESLSFTSGYSNFKKIFTYDEKFFYHFNLNSDYSDISIIYGDLKFSTKEFLIGSEIYYKQIKNNSTQTDFYSIEQNNSILNFLPTRQKNFGGKINLEIAIWKVFNKLTILYNDNLVDFSNQQFHKINSPRYQIKFEVFYKDLLFKKSLNLMAGFRFYGFSSFNGRIFSPSKLTFVDIRTRNDTLFNAASIKIPSNFLVDLIISGRVKEAANVYFSIENLFNRKFFYMPYYPANDRQFRFGLTWEFYD